MAVEPNNPFRNSLTMAPSVSLMRRRKLANSLMFGGASLATFIAVVPLLLVLYYLTVRGFAALNANFFLNTQKPPDDLTGGMKHAIVGTLMIIGIASCIGLPCGVLGGIYLSEFGKNRFGAAVRFAADVLNGIPSIVVGIFIYAVAILPLKNPHFSAWAGGLALAVMMFPTIMRTTEEILKLVPSALREGALALGDTHWHTILKVVLSTARGGVITGILLAIARISGETAPLLFTALGNTYLNTDPNKPTAALPTVIYVFATNPSEYWHLLAWGGSLVLVVMILVLSIAARYFTANRLGESS